MEQRWCSILLLLLIFYNNPFFPLNLTSATLIGGILDAIFQSLFLFMLLLFWLCALHGLRQTRRTLVYFYLPKVIDWSILITSQPTTIQAALVFPMWLSALTMEITEEFNEVRDPTFSWQLETAHYHRSKTFEFQTLFTFQVSSSLFCSPGGLYHLHILPDSQGFPQKKKL